MSYILGVNIDHVATLRNARNEGYPDVVELAILAQKAGANQITAHLREDRRHIKDQDIINLKEYLNVPLNMEMACTEEMVNIACKVRPYAVCLVPEKREEITTEGGLDVATNYSNLENKIKELKNKNIQVSIFVDADIDQIILCKNLNADAIEINTGKYANLKGDLQNIELENIQDIANKSKELGLKVHCGHGLTLQNILNIAKIQEITEFNIGHFLVSYALIVGFENSISQMKTAINLYRS